MDAIVFVPEGSCPETVANAIEDLGHEVWYRHASWQLLVSDVSDSELEELEDVVTTLVGSRAKVRRPTQA